MISGRYDLIPPMVRASLVHYICHGYPQGSFLTAVLANDLKGAISLADEGSLEGLQEIVAWIVNYAPIPCHGSSSRVEAWLDTEPRLDGNPKGFNLKRLHCFPEGLGKFIALGDTVATEALEELTASV